MSKTKKTILMLACAVMLVLVSVMGTMAYLTSQDSVTNTFTVGNVAITLDEKDVDSDANENDNTTVNGVVRDKANAYPNLLPGHTYTKDPIVHVDSVSENCWVFVKIENGLAAFEATDKTIASQIAANGWTELSSGSGVYYQGYTKNQTDKDLEVFEEFKLADNANDINGWAAISPVKVTAYAIQKDVFDDVADAWSELSGLTE